MEVIPLASMLFSAGSALRRVYRRRNARGAESKTSSGDTSVEINVDLGHECDGTEGEGAIIAVGAELAMKAAGSWFGSRTRRNRAITGLSNEFAEHRRQVCEAVAFIRPPRYVVVIFFLKNYLR